MRLSSTDSSTRADPHHATIDFIPHFHGVCVMYPPAVPALVLGPPESNERAIGECMRANWATNCPARHYPLHFKNPSQIMSEVQCALWTRGSCWIPRWHQLTSSSSTPACTQHSLHQSPLQSRQLFPRC
jgi:hypothetical protein